MKGTILSLFIFSFFISLISCKKDNGASGSALIGNWNFTSLHAKTTTTDQYNDGSGNYKTITSLEYTSTDNQGTVVINSNTLVGTGIAYKLSTNMFSSIYLENVLQDTFSFPIEVALGPVNSTTKYRLVGADSIYFEGQSLFNVDPSGSITNQTGMRYSISGKTLTLTTTVAQDTVIDNFGVPTARRIDAVLESKMEKQ